MWIRRWQTVALLSIVALMAMVIVACGDGDDDETPAPAATAAPATAAPATAAPVTAAPTQTRQRFIPEVTTAAPAATTPAPIVDPVQPRLRVAIAPPISQSSTMFDLGQLQSPQGPLTGMYDGLLANERFTEEWEGYVAESWDISTNAREWTFKLRENVSFYQRGVPTEYSVTSADILHSININYFEPWQAGNSSRYADFFYPDEEHFEIINDHEFVWKLTKPNLIWGQHQTDERRGVISKGYFEKVGWDGYIADPIGAGPFTFLDFEINRGVSMERVVDHYRQTPLIHELEFIYVNEEATRTAMLYTNEADISEMSLSLHEQAISRGYKVASSTTPSARFFMFIGGMFEETRPDGFKNCPPGTDIKPDPPAFWGRCPAGRYEIDTESPLRNQDVREALNLAINRDEMNEVFFKNTAIPMIQWSFPHWWGHHQDDWVPYTYDPDRARQLIIDAGYPNGFEMQIITTNALPGLPEVGELMEALTGYFNNVGITIDLQVIDRSQMVPTLRNRRHTRGIIPARWGSPTPGSVVGHFKNNVDWRQEWQMWDEVYEHINILEAATNWDQLRELEIDAVNWERPNHLMIPMFWLVGQVMYNPETVESYLSRHIHMGPTRHHEFTVPVYK
jgi:ABC-type transport system substrate-binding protein